MVCSRCPRESRYYEFALKKKCLQKLKNNAWETKWIRKFVERADDHYKRKVLGKYFQVWADYSVQSFARKVNKRLSDSFRRERLMSRALEALKRNVERNRSIILAFDRKIEYNLKIVVWHKWKHYTLMRLKVGKVKVLADKIREDRLAIRFLYYWLFRLKEKLHFQETNEKATKKWRADLLRKYFDHWTMYAKRKNHRKEQSRVLQYKYLAGLRSRCFLTWLKFVRQMRTLTMISSRYRQKKEIEMMITYLNVWTNRYEKLCLKKEVRGEESAASFHRFKSLEKCFTKWKMFRENARMLKGKLEEFRVRSGRAHLSCYLNIWSRRWSERTRWKELERKADDWRRVHLTESYLDTLLERVMERREERVTTAEVVNYANAVLLQRTLKIWRNFVSVKIMRRRSLEYSLEFYREKLQSKILGKLAEYVAMKSRKKMAVSHWENSILYKAFASWRILLEEKRRILEKVDNIIRERDFKNLKAIFEAWKSEELKTRVSLNKAKEFYERKKLVKVMAAWRKHFLEKRECERRYKKNEAALRNILIKSYFSKWREMQWHKKLLQGKVEIAHRKREARFKGLTFRKWRSFVVKLRGIRQAEEWFPEVRSSILLEVHVLMFLEALERKDALKRKMVLAGKTEETILKRKYLKRWLLFVSWKRETVLKCIWSDGKSDDFCLTRSVVGSSSREGFSRRQPMIPEYLRPEFNNKTDSNDSFCSAANDLTYRIIDPINKRLPVVGHSEMFVSFDI